MVEARLLRIKIKDELQILIFKKLINSSQKMSDSRFSVTVYLLFDIFDILGKDDLLQEFA